MPSSIDVSAHIKILFNDSYSQRQITNKLKISNDGLQYSLQRQLKTGTNVDRKRYDDCHLISISYTLEAKWKKELESTPPANEEGGISSHMTKSKT